MGSVQILAGLHPAFSGIATAILREAQALLDSDAEITGDLVRAVVGIRSLGDQAKAVAAGLSSVMVGWHQYGLALDYGIFDANGQKYVTDGTDPRYRLVGEIAKRHGCVYGGDWHKPDWDHIEYHTGFTLSQYLAWLAANPGVRA